jgi:hypothetical protein
MRGFFRRLNHRDAVLRDLEALLLAYPRRRQFDRDFPSLKPMIRKDFDAGVPPAVSALRITSSVIANFIDQLGEGEQERVLDALMEGGRAAFAEVATRRVKGTREVLHDRVQFVTQLIGVAIYMAGRMAEEGALRWDDYADFLNRIGAALGVDPTNQPPLARAFAS